MSQELGYDPWFLDVPVPLPSFGDELSPAVLELSENALSPDGRAAYTNYVHLSLATNKLRRQPIVVALNVDQSKIQPIERSPRWREDKRVGEYQLDNSYYRNNVWDRGHLARYKTAGWGDSLPDAQAAADATNVYTNAALQHQNFNQDEWLEIEDWVLHLEDDATQRISVFSGPIYGDDDVPKKFVTPSQNGPLAEVPAAFFKVVAFIAKDTHDLAVRAFIAVQDAETLSDKRGKRHAMFSLCTYQVSVRMIELETGLIFPSILRDRNPLYCALPNDPTAPPEMIPVGGADELVGPDSSRPRVCKQSLVRIAALRVPPRDGDDVGWVSLLNVGLESVSLSNWKLVNANGYSVHMQGENEISPGVAMRVDLREAQNDLLSENGGIINLFNKSGERVDRIRYSRKTVSESSGYPISSVGPQ